MNTDSLKPLEAEAPCKEETALIIDN